MGKAAAPVPDLLSYDSGCFLPFTLECRLSPCLCVSTMGSHAGGMREIGAREVERECSLRLFP